MSRMRSSRRRGLRGREAGRGPERVPGRIRDVLAAYTSASGRITPRTFLLAFLAPVVSLAGVLSVTGPADGLIARIVRAPLYWILFVGLAKRLQDLGFRGLALSLPPVIAIWLLAETGVAFPLRVDAYLSAALGVICLFTAFTPGQRGRNAFGAAPVDSYPSRLQAGPTARA